MKRRAVSALLCVSAVFWAFGCGLRGPRSKPSSTVCENEGMLPSPTGSYQLHVAVDASKVVKYRIHDAATGATLYSAESGSALSYWAFCWDDRGRLWVWNSDVGGALVERDRSGAWQKTDIGRFSGEGYEGNKKLYREMPKDLYDRLPETVKRVYKR